MMDTSSIEKLKERMEAMAKLQLGIGVPSSSNATLENGLNQAGLAAIHEFGAPAAGIPERSFIRSSIDEHDGYKDKFAIVTKKVMRDEVTPEVGLEMVGTEAVNDIKTKITNGIAPELSPTTIKRKGSATPLIDTGQMLQNITFEVK